MPASHLSRRPFPIGRQGRRPGLRLSEMIFGATAVVLVVVLIIGRLTAA